jgi:hypothetical protein
MLITITAEDDLELSVTEVAVNVTVSDDPARIDGAE